eukprot:9308508-Pyramimonas_sp.AAC.1
MSSWSVVLAAVSSRRLAFPVCLRVAQGVFLSGPRISGTGSDAESIGTLQRVPLEFSECWPLSPCPNSFGFAFGCSSEDIRLA